jgi:hypothetical protein
MSSRENFAAFVAAKQSQNARELRQIKHREFAERARHVRGGFLSGKSSLNRRTILSLDIVRLSSAKSEYRPPRVAESLVGGR